MKRVPTNTWHCSNTWHNYEEQGFYAKIEARGFKFNSFEVDRPESTARFLLNEKQTKKVPLLALNSLITNPVFMSFGRNFR